jgi:hypothetical protein
MTRSVISRWLSALLLSLAIFGMAADKAAAQARNEYTANQLVAAGNDFFGQVSGNLAAVIEEAVSRYGLPNGYILGSTVGGAFFAGLRFGEGTLYTQNLGNYPIYWQGPSIGFDVGVDASRTMMLVYGLPTIDAIYQRFPGVAGTAYVVGGIGMNVMSWNGVTIVKIVSGLGARVGLSVGYLKFTAEPTWQPF